MTIGSGIAIIGMWGGCALACYFGATPEIFIGATIGTIFVSFAN